MDLLLPPSLGNVPEAYRLIRSPPQPRCPHRDARRLKHDTAGLYAACRNSDATREPVEPEPATDTIPATSNLEFFDTNPHCSPCLIPSSTPGVIPEPVIETAPNVFGTTLHLDLYLQSRSRRLLHHLLLCIRRRTRQNTNQNRGWAQKGQLISVRAKMNIDGELARRWRPPRGLSRPAWSQKALCGTRRRWLR